MVEQGELTPPGGDRYRTLMAAPEAVRQAIDAETGGRIKPFAERVASATGRKAESVRRDIYRQLKALDQG